MNTFSYVRFCCTILLLCSLTVFAQKTKKVIVDDYDLFAKHEYYVLKKDKTIKHGPYKSTWVNGNPRQAGFYHMGRKDSLWIYYNRLKAIVGSRGYYENGKKVGVWEYFNDKSEIINRYDHSNMFLSYTTFKDTNKTYNIRLKDTLSLQDTIIDVKLDQSPIYLEGEKNKFRTIQDNIVYPQVAIEQNIFGTVHIAFYVTEEGYAVDHEVVKSIGGGCDEEALRVVKLIPDNWAPAIYKGELVQAKVTVYITFVLN